MAAASMPPQADPIVDREARNPALRYLLHLGVPMSASLVVHAAIIAFLSFKLFAIQQPTSPAVGDWSGSVVQAEELGQAFQWADEKPLELPEQPEPAAPLDSLSSLQNSSDADLRDLSKEPGPRTDESGSLGLGEGPLSLLGTGSGAGEAGSGGFSSGLGGGEPRIGQAGVWDLNVRANKVVYVVDFSGSIIVAVDDLKRELKRSVGRLVPAQAFDVIVFYSQGVEGSKVDSFRPQLEAATAENRRDFFKWIDRKAPMGDTYPVDAVKRALALRPEVIFLFSDGDFSDPERDEAEIKRLNRQAGARIFCLVFDELLLQDTSGAPHETDGARRLKRIAEANGGTAKIVTSKDLVH